MKQAEEFQFSLVVLMDIVEIFRVKLFDQGPFVTLVSIFENCDRNVLSKKWLEDTLLVYHSVENCSLYLYSILRYDTKILDK